MGDGVINDTAAFQACAAAAMAISGATIYIPRGNYLITGQVFNFNGPNVPSIIGEGLSSSIIRVAASVGNTIDIIRVAPSAIVDGFRFADFAIRPVSGTPGKNGIFIDMTGNDAVWVYDVVIERVYIYGIGSTGGRSIRVQANSTSVSGGFAYSAIRDCNLEAIWIIFCGDNVRIEHHSITSARPFAAGLQFDNITGAANFQVVGNVIACMTGQIYCDGGVSPYIAGNEFETPNGLISTSPNDAMVDMNGGGSLILHAAIIGNTFSCLPGTGNDSPIRINNADTVEIAHNRISTGAAGVKGIVTTASAVDTIIGPNRFDEAQT
jgi:hypothetical protein